MMVSWRVWCSFMLSSIGSSLSQGFQSGHTSGFGMKIFQQIMMVALISMNAWNSVPHLACRCSDGKILLNCPRLNQSLLAKASNVATRWSATCKSGKPCCCVGGKSSSRFEKKRMNQRTSCSIDDCRCTPIYLQVDCVTCVKKFSFSNDLTTDFQSVHNSIVHDAQRPAIEVINIDSSQREPDDLILLCERWLV